VVHNDRASAKVRGAGHRKVEEAARVVGNARHAANCVASGQVQAAKPRTVDQRHVEVVQQHVRCSDCQVRGHVDY
jgi:hypothetical protein